MDKNSKQKEKDVLSEVMVEKIYLIAEHIKEGRFRYAKIETRALKSYLNSQISIAKKQARLNQEESLDEKVESI